MIISIVMILISIVYTILVKNVDLGMIGPNGTAVGFATLNGFVKNTVGVNMVWYDITKILGIIPFLFIAFYGLIGLKQLLSTKSILKVDKKLIALGGLYVVTAMLYVFFEKCIINYRPTIIDGELEASYPSTHTMLAIILCGSSLLIIKDYIQNEKIRKIINIVTIVLMLTIVIGRIISGVHWASDIIGGIIISSTLLYIFKTIASIFESNENSKDKGN